MQPINIITGDAQKELSRLPSNLADTCITSPPYYNLRDYNTPGQIGLESTPSEYIARLVDIFRQVRRVLKNNGTLWVVMGDTFAGKGKRGGGDPTSANGMRNLGVHTPANSNTEEPNIYPPKALPQNCKPKDLIGIPWMLAFALRSDGWYLRSDIIWHKPNPMPESVTDRPTKAHEYIFLLSKSAKYHYNHEAIKEPAVSKCIKRFTDNGKDKQRGHSRRHAGFNGRYADNLAANGIPTTRNRRDVWTIGTYPYKGAHFAVFPPELIRPCIRAGSKPNGIVLDPFCGSGTTGVVALQEGRRFLGIEINPEYVKLAYSRLGDLCGGSVMSAFAYGDSHGQYPTAIEEHPTTAGEHP